MMSIGKRAAGVGAAVAMIAGAGPVALAGAAPDPAPTAVVSPFLPTSGPFRIGADAAIGGWNAGADGAVFGFNAGLAVFGLPFQFKAFPGGPLGLHTVGLAPLDRNP
jgi:hypothetical protein